MPTILLLDGARRRLPEGPSWLSTVDFTLLDAATTEEALDAVARSGPVLVVADLERNPGDALEAVRTLRAAHEVPFLVLAPKERGDEARLAGAAHVLTGEAAPDVVLAEVRRIVNLLEHAAPRVPVDAPVAFWRDGQPTEGRLVDLSSSGFLTTASEPQPVGARLEVSFKLPPGRSGKVVTGEVIVVRRVPGARSGFGARFFRLSESARRLIEGYLASRGMGAEQST